MCARRPQNAQAHCIRAWPPKFLFSQNIHLSPEKALEFFNLLKWPKCIVCQKSMFFVPVLDVPGLKETGLSSNQSPIPKRVWQLTAHIMDESLPLITSL